MEDNLMEVSKLTIESETRSFYSNPLQLNKKRKRQLKLASIIAYLDKHDNLATAQQLYRAAGYTSPINEVKTKQNGSAFISHLIKTGVLKREPYKGNTRRWTVLKVEPIGPKPVVEQVKVKVFDLAVLQEKAKEFYWSDKSDSLHDFVTKLIEEEGKSNEQV